MMSTALLWVMPDGMALGASLAQAAGLLPECRLDEAKTARV